MEDGTPLTADLSHRGLAPKTFFVINGEKQGLLGFILSHLSYTSIFGQ